MIKSELSDTESSAAISFTNIKTFFYLMGAMRDSKHCD